MGNEDARERVAALRQAIGGLAVSPVVVALPKKAPDGPAEIAAADGEPLADIARALIAYSTDIEITSEYTTRRPDGSITAGRTTVRARR